MHLCYMCLCCMLWECVELSFVFICGCFSVCMCICVCTCVICGCVVCGCVVCGCLIVLNMCVEICTLCICFVYIFPSYGYFYLIFTGGPRCLSPLDMFKILEI